jgi:hypothetical protein
MARPEGADRENCRTADPEDAVIDAFMNLRQDPSQDVGDFTQGFIEPLARTGNEIGNIRKAYSPEEGAQSMWDNRIARCIGDWKSSASALRSSGQQRKIGSDAPTTQHVHRASSRPRI